MIYGFKKEEDKEFPQIVHLETTNVCNLKCIHCPQADTSLIPNYKPEFIELELFEHVAKEVGCFNGILRLTPDGEPLIHPDWVKQVLIALNSNIRIFCFNTNGLLMDNKRKDVLFQQTDTKVAIEFSIDALYPDSYKGIRGGDYRKLLSNIFSCIEERERKALKNMKILVSCIVQPELRKGEYESFVDFWTPIVDKVITRHYVDTKGLTPKKPEVQKKYKERWPCPVVFSRLVVSTNGHVRFCPDDWLKETIITDLKHCSLKDIWNSIEYSCLRISHLDGSFKHPVCQKCTDWSVIKWEYDYVKALTDLFGA